MDRILCPAHVTAAPGHFEALTARSPGLVVAVLLIPYECHQETKKIMSRMGKIGGLCHTKAPVVTLTLVESFRRLAFQRRSSFLAHI